MNIFRKIFRRGRPVAVSVPEDGFRQFFGGPGDATPYVQVETPAPDGGKALEVLDRLTFEYRRGMARGTDPSQAALDGVLARADQLRVLDGGMWGDEAIGVVVLLESRRKADLDSLRTALRIAEDPQTFAHCACLGSQTLEFYEGPALVATLGLHHGHTIRWHPWKHDASLIEPAALARWLTDHGIDPDPKSPPEDPLSLGLLGLSRASRHVSRGQSYLKRGESQRALEECERALGIDSELASAYGLRGEVHRVAGRLEEALEDCDAAIRRGLIIPAVYHCRASVRASLGETEGALEDCDAALRLDPEDPGSSVTRAQVRAFAGNVEGALEDFTAAIRLAPGWLVPLVLRARLLLMAGRPSVALGDLNEVIQRLERSTAAEQESLAAGFRLPGMLMLRAQAFDLCGGTEPARADFDRAIEMEPEDPTLRVTRGDFLAAQGEFYDAIADFTEAIQLRPDEVVAYARRATVRRIIGDLDEAVEDLSDAIRWCPDNPGFFGIRGEIHIVQEQFDLAIEDFTRTIQLAPEAAHAFSLRAHCRRKQGEPALAREDLETALRLDPDHLMAANSLARLLATSPDDSLRDGPRAVFLAQKVVDRSAGQAPEPLDTLAAALAECGRFEDACETQRQALERLDDPERSDAYLRRLAQYEEGRPCRGDE